MKLINISSGEDAMPRFDYQPSWDHTLDDFRARMKAHQLNAEKDRAAIEVRSVNKQLQHAQDDGVIYLRDESGFGPAVIPAALSIPHDGCGACEPTTDYEPDLFDMVPGG